MVWISWGNLKIKEIRTKVCSSLWNFTGRKSSISFSLFQLGFNVNSFHFVNVKSGLQTFLVFSHVCFRTVIRLSVFLSRIWNFHNCLKCEGLHRRPLYIIIEKGRCMCKSSLSYVLVMWVDILLWYIWLCLLV